MLVGQYALLPENKSGFWVEKKFRLDDTDFAYIVFHQGMAEFSNSISEAKQKLRDRYARIQANRKVMGFTPPRKVATDHVFLAYGSPLIYR